MSLSIIQTLSDCCSKIIPLIPPKQHSIISSLLSDILTFFSTSNLTCLNKSFQQLLSHPTSEPLFYEIYQLYNNIYCFLTDDGKNSSSNLLKTPHNSDLVFKYLQTIQESKSLQNLSDKITIIMTTCKRYELFYRTVNSVLQYVRDLPDYLYEWIVIDDNSDQNMRTKMKDDFPFINFIYKDETTKGHSISMNMIFNLVKTPYIFNIEDDWEFFFEDDYITKSLNIFKYAENKNIGQVLVNINYSEDTTTYRTVRGASLHHYQKPNQDDLSLTPYWIHNYYTGDLLQQKTQEIGSNSLYWPHFSFRVGITKMDVLRQIGRFNETASHFEMEYAHRYNSLGFKTAFLNGIFCNHIGRRTYERNTEKVNAYDLNQQKQFGEDIKKIDTLETKSIPQKTHRKIEIRTFVINLKRRIDRLQSFIHNNQNKLSSFDIIDGFDGKNETPNHRIMRCFRSGDYDYRSGIVGCAISHIKTWKIFMQDKKSEYAIILEDDVNVCSNFEEKIVYLLGRYQGQFDILMLHQNPWKKGTFSFKLNTPQATRLTVDQAFKQNMGSAAAYVVSRQGVKNLFNHINQKGIYNAIDWIIMKSGDQQRVLYTSPFLVEANCFQTDQADTDIQKVFTKIKWPDTEWDINELEYLYDLLSKSVYLQELLNKSSSKLITMKFDSSLSLHSDDHYLSDLLKNTRLTSKFISSKTEGIITILFTTSIQYNKIIDFVSIIPIHLIKDNDKIQLNRYAIKWFYTNRLFYIIPDKFITQGVLLDKIFGDQFVNLLNPF